MSSKAGSHPRTARPYHESSQPRRQVFDFIDEEAQVGSGYYGKFIHKKAMLGVMGWSALRPHYREYSDEEPSLGCKERMVW